MLGSFKIVSFYDNLYYAQTIIGYDNDNQKLEHQIIVPNIPVIKNYIENELRKQIAENNSSKN